MTAVNAETTNSAAADTTANASIVKATQSVAQKLVSILGLTTIPGSELNTISLKQVVIKALGEGKQMSEIRLATNQAVKQLTGKTLSIATPSTTSSSNASVQSGATQTVQSDTISANPAEVTFDPETGKMMATVQPGESIFRLAQRVYGKENGRQYLAIFAANRDKIKDINVVVEGQILAMP